MADLARNFAVELISLGVMFIAVAIFLTALAASEAFRRVLAALSLHNELMMLQKCGREKSIAQIFEDDASARSSTWPSRRV